MQIKKRTVKTTLQFCPFARRSEGYRKQKGCTNGKAGRRNTCKTRTERKIKRNWVYCKFFNNRIKVKMGKNTLLTTIL